MVPDSEPLDPRSEHYRISHVRLVELQGAERQLAVVHQSLNELGAPTHMTGGQTLNLNGRLVEYLHGARVEGWTGEADPPHYPRRGDRIAKWLKRKRDAYPTQSVDTHPTVARQTLDFLLDDYRLRADTGSHLDEEPS